MIVRYTYNGDFTLDGQVDGDDEGIFDAFYDNGASTGNPFIDGDTNGDGLLNGDDDGLFSAILYGLGTDGDGPRL